jgi:molecular chaperone GrpE (heat shock protein)
MGAVPQVLTLSTPQFDTIIARIEAIAKNAADAAVAKTRDSLTMSVRSDQYKDWCDRMDKINGRLDNFRDEMMGIMEAVIDGAGSKFVKDLEQMLDKASKKLHQLSADMQVTLISKIDEVKALIERLKGWRITLDEQSIAQLMTHGRTHIHQAVAEAREHLAAYLTHDVDARLDAVVTNAVQKTSSQQSSGFATFARWCAVITCAIVATAAYLLAKAVKDFKPPVIDLQMLENGKTVPASDAARIAMRDYAFSPN